MRRALPALAAALALLSTGPALAGSHDRLPLRPGSAGPRVAGLQWMLAGHRPNVFGKVKGTFAGRPNGYLGAGTVAALAAYKYRIGYPATGQCGSKTDLFRQPLAGAYFFSLLRGLHNRPLCWVALAARRLKAAEAAQPSKTAIRIRAVELSQLGAAEQPPGSDCGPVVSSYMAFFHWSCGLPWCAFFQNWAFAHAGYPAPFKAPNPWYVPSIGSWAQQHGWLNAKAKVGSLVAFLAGPNVLDATHIGYVIKVLASGYVTVEGNWSDHVAEVYHPWNDRLRVFIDLPGVA